MPRKIKMPGVDQLPTGIMNQIMSGSGDMLRKMNDNFEIIASNMEEIRANQNQNLLALASVYAALEAIAAKQKIDLPKPLIDMKIEEQ